MTQKDLCDVQAKYATTYHRDRTVSYWSVYEQRWHQSVQAVPARELAARRPAEACRIQRHIAGPTR